MINLKHRRALSEVISTTILVAAMLVIVTGVMGFALQLFNVQSQEAEFSQAENGVISLAQTIDGIIPSPGASGFSSFNTRTGGPDLISKFDTMTVTILNWTGQPVWSNVVPINMFRYRAGSVVSFEGYQWLRAGTYTGLPFLSSFNNTLLIQNNSAPLGMVFISHDNGATWVSLDYRRVNLNNLGIFNISLGAVPVGTDAGGNVIYKQIFKEVNIIQLNFVNITGGAYTGSNKVNVVATNNGVITKSFVIKDPINSTMLSCVYSFPKPPNCPQITGNTYQVQFMVSLVNKLPGQSVAPKQLVVINIPYGVAVPSNASCLQPNSTVDYCTVDTIINVVVTNIQLSFAGA